MTSEAVISDCTAAPDSSEVFAQPRRRADASVAQLLHPGAEDPQDRTESVATAVTAVGWPLSLSDQQVTR
jgi:hypothetical protein